MTLTQRITAALHQRKIMQHELLQAQKQPEVPSRTTQRRVAADHTTTVWHSGREL